MGKFSEAILLNGFWAETMNKMYPMDGSFDSTLNVDMILYSCHSLPSQMRPGVGH